MSSADPASSTVSRWRTTFVWLAFALLLLAQLAVGLLGIANYWQWGHNGYNGAAYHVAARNTLRWGELFPVQYKTGYDKPAPSDVYTHAPLGLHLSTVASVVVFGDDEAAVRVVPVLNGVLALLALLLLVRRRWGDAHALVAGTIYVLLPINHIFANMVNHSTGMIAWCLAALYCYLEWLDAGEFGWSRKRWGWLIGLFAAFFMALNWDWPAYYV
ncbi:MAG: glycosyltransferase family 39 protein, partial [Deltaproteobacteria bacterium]|nr:glycosyltransferase family 39 protein [Deltaproteobacteria bacterium]